MDKKNLNFEEEVEALTADERELQRSIDRLERARTKGQTQKQLRVVEKGQARTQGASTEPKLPSTSKEKPGKLVAPKWSEPTSTLNTRIPPEMNELLNDLVYRLKKKDRNASKQQVVIRAVEASLAGHGLITKKTSASSE